MKKLTAVFLSLALAFSLAACGSDQQTKKETDSTSESKRKTTPESETSGTANVKSSSLEDMGTQTTDSDTLVVYFSMPETPYPTDHETLVDLAAEEQNNDARPAIKDRIENLEQYDTIFIGYPNWWGDMPMILYSFFDEYDFSGKNIIPFNTHGGSGFSDTINTIMKLEPDASVDEAGFTVSRNDVQDAEPDIIAWLENSGYK